MKKTVFFGLLVITFAIGFAGCDFLNGETLTLEGYWDAGVIYYEFIDDTFRYHHSGKYPIRGTFTSTSTHITFFPTQYRAFNSESGETEWFDITNISDPAIQISLPPGPGPVPYIIVRDGGYVMLKVDDGIWFFKQ